MPKPVPVVLAAGLSRRMGRPKLMLSLADRPVLAWTVAEVTRMVGSTPLVVVPPEGPVHELAGTLECTLVVNPDPEAGIGRSLAAAARFLEGQSGGLLVFLGDQPGVPDAAVTAVMTTAQSGDDILAVDSRYQGVPGHPVWLSSALFPDLGQLSGDQGARTLLKRLDPKKIRALAFDMPPPPDLDTPEDYAAWLKAFPSG